MNCFLRMYICICTPRTRFAFIYYPQTHINSNLFVEWEKERSTKKKKLNIYKNEKLVGGCTQFITCDMHKFIRATRTHNHFFLLLLLVRSFFHFFFLFFFWRFLSCPPSPFSRTIHTENMKKKNFFVSFPCDSLLLL